MGHGNRFGVQCPFVVESMQQGWFRILKPVNNKIIQKSIKNMRKFFIILNE